MSTLSHVPFSQCFHFLRGLGAFDVIVGKLQCAHICVSARFFVFVALTTVYFVEKASKSEDSYREMVFVTRILVIYTSPKDVLKYFRVCAKLKSHTRNGSKRKKYFVFFFLQIICSCFFLRPR